MTRIGTTDHAAAVAAHAEAIRKWEWSEGELAPALTSRICTLASSLESGWTDPDDAAFFLALEKVANEHGGRVRYDIESTQAWFVKSKEK